MGSMSSSFRVSGGTFVASLWPQRTHHNFFEGETQADTIHVLSSRDQAYFGMYHIFCLFYIPDGDHDEEEEVRCSDFPLRIPCCEREFPMQTAMCQFILISQCALFFPVL